MVNPNHFTHLFHRSCCVSYSSKPIDSGGEGRIGCGCCLFCSSSRAVRMLGEKHVWCKKHHISIISAHLFSISFAFPAAQMSSIAAGKVGWGVAAVWLTAAAMSGTSEMWMLTFTKNITSKWIKLTFLPFFSRFLQLEAYRKRRGWSEELLLLSGRQQQRCHLTNVWIQIKRWWWHVGWWQPLQRLLRWCERGRRWVGRRAKGCGWF